MTTGGRLTSGVTMTYPSFAELRERRIASRRAAALVALSDAEVLVASAGGRLVVFGSLAEGGFHERSDIDLAIFGLGAPQDEAMACEVDTMLTSAGFEVDVITERFMSPSRRSRVEAHGREPSTLV